MRIRLLPLIIIAYLVITAVKFGNLLSIIANNDDQDEMSLVREFNPKIANAKEPEPKPDGSASSPKTPHPPPSEIKRYEDDKTSKAVILQKKQYTFNRNTASITDKKPEENINSSSDCSDTKIELLSTLAKRREELEVWTKEAEVKQKLLQIAEAKIEQKIAEFRSMQDQLKEQLNLYKKNEDEKIANLVKIYESMKPKDAALIFNQLEMSTVLEVINQMKGSKIAAILANMDPDKARDITAEYASHKIDLKN